MFEKINELKEKLDRNRPLPKIIVDKLKNAFNIELIYNSNAIEGNTLTLHETKMVIEQGLTVGGKPFKDYLEAINLAEAIEFIEELVKDQEPLNDSNLKKIHYLVLKGIKKENKYAGVYRSVPVMISGSQHEPTQPYMISQEMEQLLYWYNENKANLHPVELASLFHFKFVYIHPFIDGNGRTARLLMNFILMQYGFPPAIVKAEHEVRAKYYNTLEIASTTGATKPFVQFIAECVETTLEKYLKYIG